MDYSDNFPTAAGDARKPEFIRLPKPGRRCPWTGLSRSGLNNLILPTAANGYRPPVVSKSLRKRGALRGTRLISYDSLMSHLKSCDDNDADAANAKRFRKTTPETTSLREMWVMHRASLRHGQRDAALCEVNIATCDDLPDDAAVSEE